MTPSKENGQHLEERFRLLVDSVIDYAILMLDQRGQIVTWNVGATRITGYAASQAIGQHISIFFPAEAIARNWPQHELTEAERVGRFEDEGWRVRRDGSRYWANVVISPLRNPRGELVGYTKVIRDLTERRRQEDALRQSEERFRLLVDGVKDYAIFMLDPDGIITSWNPGAQSIKGYAASEIIGRHFSTFYPAEAIGRNWPENELQIAREQGRFEEEGWRVRKDGSRFWASVVITALRDPDGRLRGFAKITRDLTSRKRYEELQRNERQINGFLAMLAHELRNPLDPIRHALDLMGTRGMDDRTRNWARDVIERQVGQLTRLVDDLLDVSRITQGKITLKLESVKLQDVVRGVVESVRPLAHARRQTLETALTSDAIEVQADATRIAQITLNLVTNAVKYTQPGGRIKVTVKRNGNFGEIEVADNGIGMSRDLVDHVFEPFVQGERALDRAESGLGLGLALVRRLAELHSGSATATSPGEGKGSTFAVRFPLGGTRRLPVVRTPVVSVPEPEPVATSIEGPHGGRRVLIVDDNRDAAETLRILLSAWGHEVWAVNDGIEALSAAKQHAPDAVLLDLGLPGMNGFDVAAKLREMPALRSTILIACTGYGQDSDRKAVQHAGFHHHLVKPIAIDQLEAILSGQHVLASSAINVPPPSATAH
jgi:PAS domain S-box-containing protein